MAAIPMPKEQRRARRFDVEWRAIVTGKDRSGESFQEEGMITNLSSRGAFMHLEREFVVGTKLKVCIRLPLDDESWLIYKGMIVRCQNSGRKRGIAMRFQRVRPEIGKHTAIS